MANMNFLIAVLTFTILLTDSCRRGVEVRQGHNTAPEPDTASRLNFKIPPPHPGKHRDVRDGENWHNPFLMINPDGVSLMAKAASISKWQPVSIDELAGTLTAFPLTAWPYGGVIGVMENPIRSRNDTELIKQNKEKTEEILKSLGLTIKWWPSA